MQSVFFFLNGSRADATVTELIDKTISKLTFWNSICFISHIRIWLHTQISEWVSLLIILHKYATDSRRMGTFYFYRMALCREKKPMPNVNGMNERRSKWKSPTPKMYCTRFAPKNGGETYVIITSIQLYIVCMSSHLIFNPEKPNWDFRGEKNGVELS